MKALTSSVYDSERYRPKRPAIFQIPRDKLLTIMNAEKPGPWDIDRPSFRCPILFKEEQGWKEVILGKKQLDQMKKIILSGHQPILTVKGNHLCTKYFWGEGARWNPPTDQPYQPGTDWGFVGRSQKSRIIAQHPRKEHYRY